MTGLLNGRAGVFLAGCGLAVLAGCGSPGEPGGPVRSGSPEVSVGHDGRVPGSPVVNDRWTSCEAVFGGDGSQVSPYRIARFDPSFPAVRVLVCVDAGDGSAGLRERSSSDVAPVLTALQLPDAVPSGTGVCTADGEVPLRLVLLDAGGRWVWPGIPGDVECAKRLPEVQQALVQAGLA